MKKWLAIAVVALALFSLILYQRNQITKLEANNAQLNDQVKNLEKNNRTLISEQKRQSEITTQQLQTEQSIRHTAEQNNEQIKVIIKHEPCANARLPSAVLDRLR